MYTYLRAYSLNSGLTCLLSIFIFVVGSQHTFPWLDPFVGQVYFLMLYQPMVAGAQTMSSLLDMAITLDRIGFFSSYVKTCMARISPKSICTVFLAISCAIGSVIYAQWTPAGVPVGNVTDSTTGQIIVNYVV
jgi:hypothetical protein